MKFPGFSNRTSIHLIFRKSNKLFKVRNKKKLRKSWRRFISFNFFNPRFSSLDLNSYPYLFLRSESTTNSFNLHLLPLILFVIHLSATLYYESIFSSFSRGMNNSLFCFLFPALKVKLSSGDLIARFDIDALSCLFSSLSNVFLLTVRNRFVVKRCFRLKFLFIKKRNIKKNNVKAEEKIWQIF